MSGRSPRRSSRRPPASLALLLALIGCTPGRGAPGAGASKDTGAEADGDTDADTDSDTETETDTLSCVVLDTRDLSGHGHRRAVGADAKCAAERASLGTFFTAFLSDTATDARSRVPTVTGVALNSLGGVILDDTWLLYPLPHVGDWGVPPTSTSRARSRRRSTSTREPC